MSNLYVSRENKSLKKNVHTAQVDYHFQCGFLIYHDFKMMVTDELHLFGGSGSWGGGGGGDVACPCR